MTTPAPRLTWAVRPKHLACQAPGCGREPLMGFLSEDGQAFFCAACVDDGLLGQLPRDSVSTAWRFRTAEERALILGINRR